jgi:peptidoglycan hydrolase CwlO-like protein
MAFVAMTAIALTPLTGIAATYEELQQRVQEATAAYEKAQRRVSDIDDEITKTEDEIARIERKLPTLRERAASSVKSLYLLQQSSDGILDLLFSSESFESFVACTEYLNRVQSTSSRAIAEFTKATDELTQARDELTAKMDAAKKEAKKALKTQLKTVAARDEMYQEVLRQIEADRAAAEEALAYATEEAEQSRTFTNASGQETTRTVADTSQPKMDRDEKAEQEDTKDEQGQEASEEGEDIVASERESFLANWTPRIDAYLAGSPLAGQGATFAEAAWDYNVDPRYSPAISAVESSKGAVCFLPYNAWGWGSSSWGSWEEAIRSHVAGLAATYGYTVSTSAAQMYCPPSWQAWYSSVVAEMNSI